MKPFLFFPRFALLAGMLAAPLALAQTSGSGRIVNLSILTRLAADAPDFKIGTVVRGSGPAVNKALVIRAVGPSLTAFGFGAAEVFSDPRIDVFAGQSDTAPRVANNDNWGGGASLSGAMSAVGAFPFVSAGSLDAAVAASLPPGDYVVQISGPARGLGGRVLAELYDATPSAEVTASTPRLINVSVLHQIPPGGDLTAGFVIAGGSKTVLIRAIGPGLAAFGVITPMADPQLTLFRGGAQIGFNDNWGGEARLINAGTSVGAFAVANTASRDAMLLVTLEPGDYTAQVRGVGTSTGITLVEVYDVP